MPPRSPEDGPEDWRDEAIEQLKMALEVNAAHIKLLREKLARADTALLQIRDSTHQPALILRGIAGRALEERG